jgi:ribose/xylose/arabinose/galactoside ABC-type transport system permease subunit
MAKRIGDNYKFILNYLQLFYYYFIISMIQLFSIGSAKIDLSIQSIMQNIHPLTM